MEKIIILISILFFVLEFYAYNAVKLFTKNRIFHIAYFLSTAAAYGLVFYLFVVGERPSPMVFNIAVSLFIMFVLSKAFIILFLFIEDIFRIFRFLFQKVYSKQAYFPSRKKFFSRAGVGLFSIMVLLFLDGIFLGKYRHTVRRVKLKLSGLPSAFKGYKIIQISDLHSGSFLNAEKLWYTIDMINAEKPDLVLFTGDAVNNLAKEFIPFIPLFKAIKAKDGKYSVLGNHDYAMYGHFEDENDRKQNIKDIIDYFGKSGFRVLRNENIKIEKDGQSFRLLGVENWGEPPFPQYGDIDKALEGVDRDEVKILMSHDPTHFDRVVKKHNQNIHLTLSGHTHGMQFGLDLKNIKWSPVQYRYPKWADLYESEGKYLYVNRGFGVVGYPGRVGVKPEITLFVLE